MATFVPEQHPRRLNLGCGFTRLEGYLNVDLHAFHEPDLVADVCDLAQLPDGYYEEALAQDVLEHLPRTRTRAALREWNRVLTPGGVLRVRTTSLLGLLELFRRREFASVSGQEQLVQCLFGTQAYEGDFHFTAFTEPLLRHYLEEAGFRVEKVSTVDEWLLDVRAVKVREAQPPAGSIDHLLAVSDDGRFVERCYRELLGRDPDPSGRGFYENALATGTLRREDVVRILAASDEARAHAARAGAPHAAFPAAVAPAPAAPAASEPAPAPPDNATYDRQTRAVMERCLRSDSNCVDVGCHEGSFLVQMLELAPAGTHFAFEPLPHLHDLLKSRFGDDRRVRLFDCALSDVVGEVSFQHVVTNPAYSGLRRRRYDGDERVESILVRTRPLDDLLPPDLPIHFVKIDVEGAELQVLRGARRTLARWRPVIVFEHGLGAADFYGTTPEDVHDLLEECGLRVSLLERWLAGRPPLSRAEFGEQFRRGLNYYFVASP